MLAIFAKFRRWIRQTIRRRLIFWSTIFWVVAISLISLSFMRIGQSQIINDNRQRNIQLASVISRDINAQLNSIFTDSRTFARHLESLGPDPNGQAAASLALRLSAPQRYHGLYYFDARGSLIFSLTDPLESLLTIKNAADIVSRTSIMPGNVVFSAYRETASAGISTSDVYFTDLDRSPVFYIGLPIYFTGGNTGVMVLEIDLQDIWQRINLLTIGQSGFTYIVSDQGTIIAHPDAGHLGRPITSDLKPLITGFEGFSEYTDPDKGQKVLAAYSPVGGQTGWGIVLEQDVAEANALVFRTGIYIIIMWMALATVGTLGILLMIGNFTRPIVDLTRTTQGIALTGNLKKTGTAGSSDEIGQLSAAFDQMIERLQTSEGRLASVAAEERNRLARDLHDAVSQTLFSASIIAEVLPRLWEKNPEEGRRRLEEIRQLTRGALAEMRTLLFELRPAALADAEIGYLLPQLVESLAGRTRIPVDVEIDKDCQLPPDVKIGFYRIAQEALNNIIKHAGASRARLSLTCRPAGVSLSISDNGRGFDPARLHPDTFGLNIMHDRARDFGAVIMVESKVGTGTTVTVVWSGEKKGEDK